MSHNPEVQTPTMWRGAEAVLGASEALEPFSTGNATGTTRGGTGFTGTAPGTTGATQPQQTLSFIWSLYLEPW